MISENVWLPPQGPSGQEHFCVPAQTPSDPELGKDSDLLPANFSRDPGLISPDFIPQLQQVDDSDPSAKLDCVRREELLPLCFGVKLEEITDSPLCGEVHRSFDATLDILPMSNVEFFNQPSKRPKPDISMGLGKQQAKRDIIRLAGYVKHQQKLIVRNGELFAYNGTFWKRNDSGKATIFLREVLNHSGYGEYLLTQDVNRIRDLLLTDPELQRDEALEPPEHILNLADCSYDILADHCYPHDPHDMFTSFIDITSANLRSAEHGAVFEQFAAQAGDNNPLVRTQLLELAALTLLGTEVKAFYVLLGPSNTGKTQFGRFLEELVGLDNVESIRSIGDFKDKWTTGALVGKRLVTCLDLPNSPIPGDALATLKQLAGDDSVKTERKKKDPVTIFRKPLIVFAGNHPIRIPNIADERAFLNRMVTIPFSNPCTNGNVNGHLYKSLLEEAPYIIHEAISAYRDLFNRGFQVTRAEVPEEFQPTEGVESAEHIQRFLAACCCEAPDNEIGTQELWNAYQSYAEGCSLPWQSEIAFARNLPKALRLVGITAEAKKRVCNSEARGYRGLRLVNPADDRISL